jgi:hypothetical protein
MTSSEIANLGSELKPSPVSYLKARHLQSSTSPCFLVFATSRAFSSSAALIAKSNAAEPRRDTDAHPLKELSCLN